MKKRFAQGYHRSFLSSVNTPPTSLSTRTHPSLFVTSLDQRGGQLGDPLRISDLADRVFGGRAEIS